MSEGVIVIKKGREKPILNQHPWIFSGAIQRVENNPTPGDIVTVVAQDGSFLARGYWNPKSQIQVRILTWQDESINEDWWRRMLKRVIESRAKYLRTPWSFRLLHAENDFIPGLIADCYTQNFQQRWLVIQVLTLGIEKHKELVVRILSELMDCEGIYERSDVDVRRKEGLREQTGILWGKEPPNGEIQIDHPEFHTTVNIRTGHKTGFYLDQQDNYSLLAKIVGLDDRIQTALNLFSYTGSFGLGLLHGGSHVPQLVIHVDSSSEALALGARNLGNNEELHQNAQFVQADVFQYLRDAVQRGDQYDVVILDPPKFAHNKRQIAKASKGYKDINLNAFRVIRPGGYLMTFSCSGAISPQLFQQIVFGALADSGRQAQILRHLGPGDDHPVALTFPEGAYLKGLLLRVY